MLEILGRGGFGTVYRAELLGAAGFTRTVAIKVLNAAAQGDERLLGRLRDEARFLGLLHHRAIVQVHGLVQLAGRWAVVLEYVPGCSLYEARRGYGPLPLGVGVEIAEEVASALAEAWEAPGPAGEPLRLLHRDVKPGNIQITNQGEVKLLDFGVARADMAEREGQSAGLVYGSLPYLSPERLLQRDGPEADIFALGATLLETIAERLPGNVSETEERHALRIEAGKNALASIATPTALAESILSCLAWEPRDRPTAREFERTLRALRKEIPGISLRQWAEDELARIVTPVTSAATADELTGQVLTEEAPPSAGALAGVRRAEATFDDPATLKKIAIVRRTTPAPAPRSHTPGPASVRVETRPPPSGWMRRVGLLFFWVVVLLLVVTAGAGLLVAGTGVAGMAGLAGLVAMVWPDVVRDGCYDEFAKADARIRATTPTRGSEQVLTHLHNHAPSDCRNGGIGLWEQVTFGDQAQSCSADGLITDAEARVLIDLYNKIRTP